MNDTQTYRANWNVRFDAKMFECEVCWNCGRFNKNYMECWYPITNPESEYSVPGDAEYIENPAWYRCAYWMEGDR